MICDNKLAKYGNIYGHEPALKIKLNDKVS
jgi:hypothetical protein